MALCSLSDVKSYLNITTTNDDALLNRLIAAVSDFIPRYLSRPAVELGSFTKVLNGNGKDFVILDYYPIATITSVVIGQEGLGQVTLSSANYTFDQERKVYLNIGFSGQQSYLFFPIGRRNVTITGTAGYSPIPDALVQAAIEIVALRYKEIPRTGVRSKALAGESISFIVTAMQASTATTLEAFKNRIPQ